jgi:hypothetical protein
MKFNPNEDFSKNISKLLLVLQNMLKNQKIDQKELNDFFGKKNINLNVCFFTFLPYSLEDLEGLDAEDLDENGNPIEFDLKFELNKDDMDFLGKHGLKF